MHISIERAVDGFIGYMADQVAQIPKAVDRFLGFGALASLKRNPSVIISRVRPWLEMAGILDVRGIDTDALKAALDEGFSKVPNLSYFGFTFTSADIAPLLEKMTGQEDV